MKPFYTNVQQLGNNVLVRGIDSNGKRFKQKVAYKPTFYTPAKTDDTPFTSLKKEKLEPIQFDSIDSYREFNESYKNVSNYKLFGSNRHDYSYINEQYKGDIESDLSKLVIGYIDIEVYSGAGFPKPEEAHHPVTAITYALNNGTFYVFGCKDFHTNKPNILYKKCEDEKDLLRSFIEVWNDNPPDICSGWSSNYFDFTYLINRMERLFLGADGENLVRTLSPWGWVKSRERSIFKKTHQFFDIFGVCLVDYLDLYKKYSSTPNQESHKLNFIAHMEVGAEKINYSEYKNLHTLYERDYQKFIEYNIRDVELVMMIEEKTRLMELCITLAYDSKVNFDDVFSQVRMWDVITVNKLLRKNIIVAPKNTKPKSQQFTGAYVKNTIPGMYRWLTSFDFDSLYPHLMMMFNLSPDSLLEPQDYPQEIADWIMANRGNISIEGMLHKRVDTSILKKYNLTLTPNCQLFRIDEQGFLAELMNDMYEDRSKYKKLMNANIKALQTASEFEKPQLEKNISRYNNLQLAKKVCLNSAYGAIGNEFFRFFDVRIAEAVTMSAQLAVLWIQKNVNEFLNKTLQTNKVDYVIASDTDSVYLDLSGFVDKTYSKQKQKELGSLQIIRQLDKICEGLIQPFIDNSCVNLKEYTNAYAQKLVMKREALADKAIWTGKKHYIINIYNNEGIEYAKPKLKIVGMEAIKSSTSQAIRKKMIEAYHIMIDDEDKEKLVKFIDNFRTEFFALSVEEVGTPSSINGLDKYRDERKIYGFKTPAQVKGALIYNHWLKEHNLTNKYEEIKEGEKAKRVYLLQPNPIQSEVISFIEGIPEEFGLEKYIDYNTMFEKTFLGPITDITNAIKWKIDGSGSLDDLFG